MHIKFFNFDTDPSIVAPVIYGTKRHETTSLGVTLSSGIAEELRFFFSEFNAFIGAEQCPYYRIDAYFDEQTLWILEINASFVDGWGTALNLARASKIPIDPKVLAFPQKFATTDTVYLPEMKLFLSELTCRGLKEHKIYKYSEIGSDEPVYVYGRVGSKKQPHILPYDGLRLDNKLNLGTFSREWCGEFVRTPEHHIRRFEDWENVPHDVVLKFCNKDSFECQRARQSVMFQKPSGKAPFLRQCYCEETLLAQNIVRPTKQGANNCQLIIFVIGDEPITGYVQYSQNEIINDNSIHGPLKILN